MGCTESQVEMNSTPSAILCRTTSTGHVTIMNRKWCMLSHSGTAFVMVFTMVSTTFSVGWSRRPAASRTPGRRSRASFLANASKSLWAMAAERLGGLRVFYSWGTCSEEPRGRTGYKITLYLVPL